MTNSPSPVPAPDDEIEILAPFDSGLFGRVYRATQKRLGRVVAVKIIKTEYKSAGALAHAMPLARVNHPAIVTVFDLKEIYIPDLDDRVPAIVMEWIDGVPFAVRLTQHKFTTEEAALLCRDLLDGIEHLHSQGICHRDLNNGNIIILPNGHAKIIDIDANKEITLEKLSSRSQEGAIAADIDYCRWIISTTLRHSDVPLSAISDYESRLNQADSVDALRQLVDAILHQPSRSEADPSNHWLSSIAKSNATSEEVVSLLDTQTFFDLLEVPYPATREEVLQRLNREGLIVPSASNWSITNLAAIVLAKRLDSFSRALARKAPRFVEYDGTNKTNTKTDQSGLRGYAVGFKALVNLVHTTAPQNQYLEVAIREEIKMFPKQALRELIANALVHQDFSASGTSVMIEMYADRVEISNPGVPAIPANRFIDEYQSRNEHLAELMRRLGICEEKGSGIDKVVSAAELYQLPAPDFRVSEIRTTAILFAHQDFADMTKSDRIRACYQHCVLQYLNNKRMSNQSLRERFGVHESKSATISLILNATKEARLIKSDETDTNSTRYARYLPFWG